MSGPRPFVIAAVVLLAGCPEGPGSGSGSKELRVFAAASLSGPLQKIKESFEARNQGVRVLVNASASSALERQLEAGSPCDVFIAAAPEPVERLVGKGLLDGRTVAAIASNSLVAIVPVGAKPPSTLDGLSRLAVAAEGVPAGDYARTAIAFWLARKGREPLLVSYPDEPSVVTAVAEGGAPAGIVYASSLVCHPRCSAVARAFSLDDLLVKKVVYPAALATGSREPALARAFLDHLQGARGKAELRAAGFLVD